MLRALTAPVLKGRKRTKLKRLKTRGNVKIIVHNVISVLGKGTECSPTTKRESMRSETRDQLTVYLYQLQSLFYLLFPAEYFLQHLLECKSGKILPVN